ncbi:hypothetical protein, partial [Actinocorallia lasiicapitis]
VPDGLLAGFGDVRLLDWSAEFRPLPADGWMPRPADLPILERWLQDRWRLPACELVLDGVASGPGRSLAALLSDAPITVLSCGLDGYGATPELLPEGVGSRIEKVLYLDFFDGLPPMLLHEYHLPRLPVAAKAVRSALSSPGDGAGDGGTAWIVAERFGEDTPFGVAAAIRAEQVRAVAARG